ncbi:NAD(P)-binding protein [Diplogelasinospora grovesii]|uniref:NAD(P)-binding protein n=1 Tax=Diplogelasinospora grovesii TaxID=303347 RepID=A0AAN6N1P6_9PEZI|nr:NAD(P)-binding protein [Diplogelasinospora grovesii]
MATIAKTVVATGCSSGLGFEAIKNLLNQSQPHRFILGARDVARTQSAFDALNLPATKSESLSILPLELSNLKTVQTFAQQTLQKLGNTKIDYLLLNAAVAGSAEPPTGPNGSKWCEPYVVNHLAQHYLIHLLKQKLVESRSRIVIVSSGAIRSIQDPSVLERDMKAGAGTPGFAIYGETKFVQLLAAHWWRRQLAGSCDVVAVSPGLIPGTGLTRGLLGDKPPPFDMKDAKSIPEGAENILRAFTRTDFPDDKDLIFLTSWGEWWGKDVIGKTCDKALQDRWSPSKEQIEQEEGLSA